jgi:hypothetical protein
MRRPEIENLIRNLSMKNRIAHFVSWASALTLVGVALAAAAPAPDPALVAAVADPGRTATFVARDPARHPAEELASFGIKPNMTVVELWPGGGYWTEILGPIWPRAAAPTTWHWKRRAMRRKTREPSAGAPAWRRRKTVSASFMKPCSGRRTWTLRPPDRRIWC